MITELEIGFFQSERLENYDYGEDLSSELVQDQPANAVDIHSLV